MYLIPMRAYGPLTLHIVPLSMHMVLSLCRWFLPSRMGPAPPLGMNAYEFLTQRALQMAPSSANGSFPCKGFPLPPLQQIAPSLYSAN